MVIRSTGRVYAPYLGFATAVFFVGVLIGAAAAVGGDPLGGVFEVHEEPDLTGMTTSGLFAHNLGVLLTMVLGGVFFGVPTILLLVYNGLLLGAVTVEFAGNAGVLVMVLAIAPHAIVELPAILLAGAVAFRLLHVVWRSAREKPLETPIHAILLRVVTLLVVSILLLFVAAWIEASVTPRIVQAAT